MGREKQKACVLPMTQEPFSEDDVYSEAGVGATQNQDMDEDMLLDNMYAPAPSPLSPIRPKLLPFFSQSKVPQRCRTYPSQLSKTILKKSIASILYSISPTPSPRHKGSQAFRKQLRGGVEGRAF
jgi:hypothetical protein